MWDQLNCTIYIDIFIKCEKNYNFLFAYFSQIMAQFFYTETKTILKLKLMYLDFDEYIINDIFLHDAIIRYKYKMNISEMYKNTN